MIVCGIWGWGRIQFMNKSEERQDAIGEIIVKILNESGADQIEFHYEEPEETNAFSSTEKVVQFELDQTSRNLFYLRISTKF